MTGAESGLDDEESGRFSEVDRGFTRAEGERSVDEEFELVRAEAQVEATLKAHDISRGSRRTDASKADQFDGKEFW